MRKGFDIIAPYYDLLARCVFGNSICKSQLATLEFIPKDAVILIMGGGTGWYLKELLLCSKAKRVVYIDSSEKMLALSKNKMASFPQEMELVDFRLGTHTCIQPGERFDLIITHFFLDLFTDAQLNKLMQLLSTVLNKNCLWLCADFHLPDRGSGRWWKKVLIHLTYAFFRLCCNIKASRLPEIYRYFKANDMHSIYESFFYSQLIVTQVYKKNSMNN
jgi:ubiquinone/menaquinone biosynthesis C-methylase UbiE